VGCLDAVRAVWAVSDLSGHDRRVSGLSGWCWVAVRIVVISGRCPGCLYGVRVGWALSRLFGFVSTKSGTSLQCVLGQLHDGVD